MSPLLRPLRRAWWTVVWHVSLPMVGGGLRRPLMRLVPGWVSDRTWRRIQNWLHRVELIPTAWAGRACWEIDEREKFEALRVPCAFEKLTVLGLRAIAYGDGRWRRWRIQSADASPTDGDLREFLMQPICRSPDELLAVAEALRWYAYLRGRTPGEPPEGGQGG